MKTSHHIVLALSLLGLALPVTAAETTGLAELGYLSRSGNTDSSDLNAKIEVSALYGEWKQSAHASMELSEEDNSQSAERYTAGLKTEYRFAKDEYAFATIDYERDQFAAYALRWTETLGYGRVLLSKAQQNLALELGLGARQVRTQAGLRQNDAIARLALNYKYRLQSKAEFSNKLLIESGADNTYLQNDAALRMPLLDNVSLKVAYSVRHNTDVPAATEKTDTVSSVNLAYSF